MYFSCRCWAFIWAYFCVYLFAYSKLLSKWLTFSCMLFFKVILLECYFCSSERNQYKLCFPARKRWGKEKSIKYHVNKVSSRNVHYWSTGTHELVDWCLYELKCFNSKNSHQRWSIKKLFWKVSQYLHEPSVLKSLFLKFINKRLQLRCFPVNIMKFLRTPFLKNICERLLLPFESSHCLLRVLHSIFL